jgi:hypothetical protein
MSKPHHDPPKFGELRVMLWIMGTSLLAYGLAVGFIALTSTFGKRSPPAKREPVRWMPPRTDADPTVDFRYLLSEMTDPSLFGLPNRHGFSQSAWRNTIPATFHASNDRVSGAMLPGQPPPPFDCIMGQPTVTQLTIELAHKPPETPVLSPSDADIPTRPATNTAFRLMGPLADRQLLRPVTLSPVVSATPLRITRLLIGADAHGVVRYSLLARSSGDPAADERGLTAARGLRFAPIAVDNTDGLTWSDMFIMWAIEDATPTPAPATTGVNGTP